MADSIDIPSLNYSRLGARLQCSAQSLRFSIPLASSEPKVTFQYHRFPLQPWLINSTL